MWVAIIKFIMNEDNLDKYLNTYLTESDSNSDLDS
jgi:hypothetical protein